MKRYFSYIILLLKITRAQDQARSSSAAGCPDWEAERKICSAAQLCPQCLLIVSTPSNLSILEGHYLLSGSISQEELPLLSLSQQTCFKTPARKTDPRGQGICVSSPTDHIPYIHGLTEAKLGFKGEKNYNNYWLKPKRCQSEGFNRFVP